MVLVIIGFIVGGVLVGKDLINLAAQRAQITQIEKYNTAVHTFQVKYGGLPGDLADPTATKLGFQSRGQYAGEGDGNGILEANCANAAGRNDGTQQGCGELAVFWQDLSTAHLLDITVPTGADYPNTSGPMPNSCCVMVTGGNAQLSSWIPPAKLGQGNYVWVYSLNGVNYFVVQLAAFIGWNIQSAGSGTPVNAMTVQQAYNIDSKIDDGLPQSGSVTACGNDYSVYEPLGYPPNTNTWAAGSGNQGAGGANCTPTTVMTPYHSYNCFDNNNVAGTEKYSVAQNANAPNCALSFRFQ